MLARLDSMKWDMFEERSCTRKTSRHADCLHAKELIKG